jgi:hypothetical protein
MAKAAKVQCDRCGHRVQAGLSFCKRCGAPTTWATHEERTWWEVNQWRSASKPTSPANIISLPASERARRWFGGRREREASAALTLVRRKIRTDEDRPSETIVIPAASAAPAVAPAQEAMSAQEGSSMRTAVIEEVAAPEPVEPELVPHLVPASEVVPMPEPPDIGLEVVTIPEPEELALAVAPPPITTTLAPSALDEVPIHDTEATYLAMRILNARVAELDAKVRKLERKISRRYRD